MRVTQGLLGVEAQADVAAVGRRRAVARARALVVTAAAARRARGPGRPAGPGAVGCGEKTHVGGPLEHLTGSCLLSLPLGKCSSGAPPNGGVSLPPGRQRLRDVAGLFFSSGASIGRVGSNHARVNRGGCLRDESGRRCQVTSPVRGKLH